MKQTLADQISEKRGEQARLARAERESALPIEPSRGDISLLEYLD